MASSAVLTNAGLIGSSLIGTAGSLGSSLLQGGWNSSANTRAYHYQRNLMNLQAELNKEYNIWSMQHAPSLVRQGYESAGYNPILALGSNVTNANAVGLGSASQPNPINSDLSSALTNAYKVYQLEKDRTKAEVNATNAGADFAREQAKTEEFKRSVMESQTLLNDIERAKKSLDVSYYERTKLTELESMYLNSRANMLGAKAAMNQANTARMSVEATSDYYRELARSQGLENDFWMMHPNWYGAKNVSSTVRDFGIGAGALGGKLDIGNAYKYYHDFKMHSKNWK